MKKIIIKAVPILMLLTIIVITILFTGVFGVQSDTIWLKYAIWLLMICYAFAIVLSGIVIIMEKGNPTKSLAWIVIILLLPGLGVILYSFFGAQFSEESRTHKKNESFLKLMESYNKKDCKQANTDEEILTAAILKEDLHPAIRRNISTLSKNPKAMFSQNNRLQMLIDGKETFDAIFEAIRSAKHHVHLEYFIWTDDELGQDLKELLKQKITEGVQIRVIVDGLGSLSLDNSYIRELRHAGIEMAAFRPVRWAFLNSRFNFRNHRKIVVVDGQIGFTGGINVDGKYLKGDPKLGHWRDTHLKIEGDAVKGLQLTFLADWHFLMEKYVSGEEYFPTTKFTNQRKVHIVASDADEEWDGIKNAYLTTLNSAKDYVWLCTPYLVPGETMINAFKAAATAGIEVRLIVPKNGDSTIVQNASNSYVEELLTFGVKVYQYQEGFIHSKVMIADDEIGTIGTSNLDIRSFDQNLEINAFFYDRTLVKDLKNQFEKDFKKCKPLNAHHFAKGSVIKQLGRGACRLLAPLL